MHEAAWHGSQDGLRMLCARYCCSMAQWVTAMSAVGRITGSGCRTSQVALQEHVTGVQAFTCSSLLSMTRTRMCGSSQLRGRASTGGVTASLSLTVADVLRPFCRRASPPPFRSCG
jgi:hypothetical protein